MTNSIGITKALSTTTFTAQDFDGLKGMEFDNPYLETELVRVLEWEFVADEDTDGFFLRFEITAVFTAQGHEFQETFVLWIDDEEGEATIVELRDEPLTIKVNPERIDPIMDRLGL